MKNNQSILVIDDSQTVRRLAELVLSEEGYDVITASDGDEGLNIAKEKLPSLIIVDFIMPRMNGFQFCKNIRSDLSLSNIPIVLITSKGEDVGKGFDEKFGIVQYLRKPFETETLTKTVAEALAGTRDPSVSIAETADESVPEYAATEAETALHMTMQKPAMSADTPFVEITAGNTLNREVQTEATSAQENPFISIQDTEAHPHAEAAPEPLSSEDADTAAAEASPETEEAVAPVYAVLQENIKKEFRHYFGQELEVLLKNTMIQSLKETDLVRSSRRILSGEVTYISMDNIMKFIGLSGISGKLSVLTDIFNSEIYLENGLVAFAAISRYHYRTSLEELILKNGHPLKDEILKALSDARGSNLKAGSILLERKLITENELLSHYRYLSKDAVQQTLSATSGHFYVEDMPLPVEIQDIKLELSLNGVKG